MLYQKTLTKDEHWQNAAPTLELTKEPQNL